MPTIDESVEILKAAGEPTRLRLLALLAAGELSVKDLTEILGQSQPRVSRHLRLLGEAGVILRHAEGAWAYFRLADKGDGAQMARQIVGRLDATDPQIAADRSRLMTLRNAQRDQAASYFSKIAGSWDLLRSLHVAEEAVEAAIIAQCSQKKAELLLDLGTGTGRMLELLSGHYKQGIGVDSSREMLAVARAKLSAAQITDASIRLGDIAELSDYAGAADLIVIHQVLHYFDDPAHMLQAARGALRAGGRMLIVDFAPHNLEFLRSDHAHRRLGLSQANMADWAAAAGLQITAQQDFLFDGKGDGLTVCLWTLEDAEAI